MPGPRRGVDACGDTIQSSYGQTAVGILGQESVLVIDPLITPPGAAGEAALRLAGVNWEDKTLGSL